MYCGLMGVELPENWNFYLAFAFFRLAVVLQGRHRGSLAGEEPHQARAQPWALPELPPCSSTAWSCLLLVLWDLSFPGRTEQRPELGARSCVLQMELSDLPAQHQPLPRAHREVVRAVCLHTAGVAWEPLSELNLMLFSHPLERSFPASCWAGPEEGTRCCLGCDYVTQALPNKCPVLLSPGRPAPADSSPKDAEFVAELAWDFAIKEGFRVFESLPPTKLLARHSSTWAGQGPFLSRSYSTWARPGAAPVPTVPLVTAPSSLLGMAQGLCCKMENLGIQWGFLSSHSRGTPCPLPELQVRHLC